MAKEPRLTWQQENAITDPYARSSSLKRWQVAKDAKKLGHLLGPWEPAEDTKQCARRAECQHCSAEVFVDWRGSNQGWQRAASLEIQLACTNDCHTNAAQAKAFVSYKVATACRKSVESLLDLFSGVELPANPKLAESIATEARIRLAQYTRHEEAAKALWERMLQEVNNAR